MAQVFIKYTVFLHQALGFYLRQVFISLQVLYTSD